MGSDPRVNAGAYHHAWQGGLRVSKSGSQGLTTWYPLVWRVLDPFLILVRPGSNLLEGFGPRCLPRPPPPSVLFGNFFLLVNQKKCVSNAVRGTCRGAVRDTGRHAEWAGRGCDPDGLGSPFRHTDGAERYSPPPHSATWPPPPPPPGRGRKGGGSVHQRCRCRRGCPQCRVRRRHHRRRPWVKPPAWSGS